MKMTAVDDRLAELESRRLEPGLSVAEQNELRDCEITLGMVDAPHRARAEAARRVERYAAERAAQETPAHFKVTKVGGRWQPVHAHGIARGKIYNADGKGYSTREAAEEAAEMFRKLGKGA